VLLKSFKNFGTYFGNEVLKMPTHTVNRNYYLPVFSSMWDARSRVFVIVSCDDRLLLGFRTRSSKFLTVNIRWMPESSVNLFLRCLLVCRVEEVVCVVFHLLIGVHQSCKSWNAQSSSPQPIHIYIASSVDRSTPGMLGSLLLVTVYELYGLVFGP
jgi:hypothetical protein